MANQQLVDYIKSQLAAGVTKQDLQKAIAAAGWTAQDMNDAFAVVEGKAPVAPAPLPARPIPPVQPQPQMQPRPATQAQPVVQPMRPATMQMNVGAGRSPRRTWPWAVLLIIILLVAAAAAAYVYLPPVQQIVGFYLGVVQPAPAVPVTMYPAPMEPASTTPDTTATSSLPLGAPAGATSSQSH